MTKEQYQDTFHGIVKAGELNDKTVVHNRWWRDMYLNLYFDDQLWANMIWGAECHRYDFLGMFLERTYFFRTF